MDRVVDTSASAGWATLAVADNSRHEAEGVSFGTVRIDVTLPSGFIHPRAHWALSARRTGGTSQATEERVCP